MISMFNDYYMYILFLGTVNVDHCISLLLRLLDCLENSCVESLLFGASSSNQRIQFDIQRYDVVSLNAADVSQLPGTDTHGFTYY